MDGTTAALAAAIGGRIRHERQVRALTLDQLAEVAGVSRRMLINVEQGAANPSIGTLLRIGDALGVGLPALVESPQPKATKVTRNGDGAVLWSSGNGGRGVLVAGTGSLDVVELWDWTLGPGDAHESEAHSTGTKELLQVRSGQLTVQIEDQSVTLEIGDALSFSGDRPHAYRNSGAGPTCFSLAVFEPGVGQGAHAESVHE